MLLVDDDPLIRDCLADLLVEIGWRVTATASAEEALLVDASGAPDVLITDMLLGRGNERRGPDQSRPASLAIDPRRADERRRHS